MGRRLGRRLPLQLGQSPFEAEPIRAFHDPLTPEKSMRLD
jgi:hypothetical protein